MGLFGREQEKDGSIYVGHAAALNKSMTVQLEGVTYAVWYSTVLQPSLPAIVCWSQSGVCRFDLSTSHTL